MTRLVTVVVRFSVEIPSEGRAFPPHRLPSSLVTGARPMTWMPGPLELALVFLILLLPLAVVVAVVVMVVRASRAGSRGQATTCPACHHPNSPANRFCAQCGRPLGN